MTDKAKIIKSLLTLEFNIRSAAQYTRTDDMALVITHIANAIGDTIDELRQDLPEN